MQVIVQNSVLVRTLQAKGPVKVPRVVCFLNRYPLLRRIPARLVGMGFRAEHVRTPELPPV